MFLILFVAAIAVLAREETAIGQERIQRLRAEIARHDELYFKQAAPEISDAEYDRLKRELLALETQEPETARPAAVGDDRSGAFLVQAHGRPMLSLDKAYTAAEWKDFYARVTRRLGGQVATLVIEPKYDGVAISLVYEQGRLVRAVTRGNGREGDDVTPNVRTIAALPGTLAHTTGDGRPNPIPDLVELRGEVYIDEAEFLRLNALRESAGEDPFAHPRSLAAGTLKSFSAGEIEGRRMAVVIHGWGEWKGAELPATQQAFHAQVWAWGLPGVPRFRAVRSSEEGWEAIQELRRDRPRLGFPIDGAVAKLDDVGARVRFGESERAPRWAIAYKYEPEQAVAQIRAITVQVGRTGVLTPVAELQPVELGGTRITRATLHNRAVIARRDIRVGDFVGVEKAGEIIPAVTTVRLEQRPPGTKQYLFPERCPSCRETVESAAGESTARCLNSECPGQRQRRLEHFASSEAVGIEGMGPATIAILVREGLVKSPSDFYRLRPADLAGVEGISVALGEKLIAAIDRSRRVELWRFLYGLGIPQIGAVNSRKLATACGSLATLGQWNEEGFAAVVGAAAGRSLTRYLASETNRANLQALVESGVSAGP